MSEPEGESLGASTLAVRTGAGFFQGLALYGLYHWQNQLNPIAFGALVTAAWLGPIVFLGAFGALRPRWLILWTSGAVVIAAVLGGYTAYVHSGESWILDYPLPSIVFFIAVTLYILHHLIVPAATAGRWRAEYQRYFDEAWMDAVRLAQGGDTRKTLRP